MKTAIIDHRRSVALCDVGSHYIAATVIDSDGIDYLMLASPDDIGTCTLYDPTCVLAVHEQVGKLPLEYVRRIAVSRRGGRP
ncbi:hypothetical protein MMAN_58010 [Mycobacterium mantenii]|uniref:Uncharacterized protein n=1 Tax=Mycobacterium mantenii TaxID=560555 RepID=A0A1X0G3Y3_MYCNT|nr:hypothetical protein [Mycobacterium mantenii]MCV7243823.1 hypothetical protein [Mycobacterium mantenii]ORB08727.1 hypothetical protein BST30_01950 [Mycobacterium mantenii]BBY35885.1 hypothetical protein MMAN_00190 [Mycobacterium mantenii]BBY41667.1 hypothetical protein MMAN_58010 [Mycobacterium mantenii]